MSIGKMGRCAPFARLRVDAFASWDSVGTLKVRTLEGWAFPIANTSQTAFRALDPRTLNSEPHVSAGAGSRTASSPSALRIHHSELIHPELRIPNSAFRTLVKLLPMTR